MGKNTVVEYATSDEVIKTLENLSKADKSRLNSFAKHRILELQHCNWEDLLSVAIERAIAGTRKWPKNISFLKFMGGCIRSIASEIYRQEKERKSAGIFSENNFCVENDSDSEGIIDSVAEDVPNQEDELISKERFGELESFFENDEDAFNVLYAKEEGHSPLEIQAMLNINKTQYATILKRISRKLPILHEKGAAA